MIMGETQEITGVVPVDLWGVMRRVLMLRYTLRDPVAVALEVNGGSWHVARARLLNALGPAESVLPETGDEGAAAAVQVLRLPGVCCGYLRLVLRTPGGACWPMAIGVGQVTEFLTATYMACSLRHEQHLVATALAAQVELIAATTRGPR